MREDELDELLAKREKLEGMPLLKGPDVRERLRRQIERSGRFVDGRLELAIEADGRLLGTIDARFPERFIPQGVYELGILLFDVGDRGKGYGGEAVELITRHLFEEREAGRVQAGTSLENVAMRRVFERLGFTEEGVMRAFMPTPDGREDYVLYAITREDWTKLGR
jgi:RimJ/RimL family protein N-acetyltransferase